MSKQYYIKKTKPCKKCGYYESKKIWTSLQHRCFTCDNDATVFHFISSGKLDIAYCEKCAFSKSTYNDEFIFAITYRRGRRKKISDYEKARLMHNFFVFIPNGINVLDVKTIGEYIRDNFFIKDWNKKPYKLR